MRAGRVLVALGLGLSLAACEWFSTMSDPADIQPHEREPWPPPSRSVPLGGRAAFTLADVNEVGLVNPRPADSTSVAVGEAYYAAFCTVCHGGAGLGNGPISDKFPAIPSLVTPTVAGHTDAYVFGLITQGRGLMPEYSRIPATARWDIVNFVRTLPGRAPAAADTTAAAGADTSAAAGAGGPP